jgi:hypothetical protein
MGWLRKAWWNPAWLAWNTGFAGFHVAKGSWGFAVIHCACAVVHLTLMDSRRSRR